MLPAVALVILVAAVGIAGMYLLSRNQPEKSKPGQRRRPAPTQKERAGSKRMAKGGSSIRKKTPGWLKVAPFVALGLAVLCLVLALTGFRFTQTATGGAAMLTMDVSQSMNQQDVEPNRLDAAVAAARTFLDQLPEGLRVGLVTFADDAVVVVPPVEDREQVSRALDDLPRGKGTVIGDGLARSLDEIERDRAEQGTQAAAVVLLSDGRDTGSATTPEAAADRAAELAVPVHTVVLGQADTGEGDSGANVELLQQIATTTQGQTFTAASAGELDQIYETLGQQLSTDLAIDDSGTLFYVLAAIFAGLAAVLVMRSSRPSY
jgi:Ca-activated chloride channel family protein